MPEDYHRAPLVRLRSEHAPRLRRIAEETSTTVPAIVSAAITEYLERHDTDEREEQQ